MIICKSPKEIEKLRRSGRMVREVLGEIRELVRPGVTTLDLEQFVASIGAGIVLLGLVAGLAGYAGVLTLRSDRPAVGVVGGAAGVFSPVALLLLSLGDPFPLLVLGSAALSVLGAFVVGLRAIQMMQTGPAAV